MAKKPLCLVLLWTFAKLQSFQRQKKTSKQIWGFSIKAHGSFTLFNQDNVGNISIIGSDEIRWKTKTEKKTNLQSMKFQNIWYFARRYGH